MEVEKKNRMSRVLLIQVRHASADCVRMVLTSNSHFVRAGGQKYVAQCEEKESVWLSPCFINTCTVLRLCALCA